MPNNDVAVRCLLIHVNGAKLILPNAVIAEVTSDNYDIKLLSNNQPNWLLGTINWRNQRIPLLAIEEALSLPITTSSVKKYRIIVLYGLESTQAMPFYAFRAIDVPRTIAVTEASLTNPSTNVSRGLTFKVMYNTEVILLPNLTYLEKLLKTFPMFFS